MGSYSSSNEIITEQAAMLFYLHPKNSIVRADTAGGVSDLESFVPEHTILDGDDERNESAWTGLQTRPSLKHNLIIVLPISASAPLQSHTGSFCPLYYSMPFT